MNKSCNFVSIKKFYIYIFFELFGGERKKKKLLKKFLIKISCM